MDAMTGMIFMVPFDWAPRAWLTCRGQILNIQQYQAVFSLIATTYGGDMKKGTFGLPNLSGRTAIGSGQSTTSANAYAVSKVYGAETTTLTVDNIPPHIHPATFTPIMGSQNITIPAQTGPLKIKMNVASAAGGSVPPGNAAILGTGAGPTSLKIYAPANTTPAPATTPLADAATSVEGTAPTKEQVVSVNTVTGGTVSVGTSGAGTAFSTLQPSLALNFIITLSGLYPSKPD